MKKLCEKDCKARKMTISIINKTEMFSTTNYNSEESGQKYQEQKEEDTFSREKFLELSVNELRGMVQTGTVLRKE